MTNSNGANYDHLMRQLDARLERIEVAIDRLADQQAVRDAKVENRLSMLELYKAEAQGGWKALTIAGSIGATIAGAAGAYVTRLFG